MRWWIPSQGRSLSVCSVTNSVTNSVTSSVTNSVASSVAISGRRERAWNFWSPQIELWCFLSLEMEPWSLWRYGTPLASYCTPNFLKFCLGVGVGSARSASLSTAAPQPKKIRSFFPRLWCCMWPLTSNSHFAPRNPPLGQFVRQTAGRRHPGEIPRKS